MRTSAVAWPAARFALGHDLVSQVVLRHVPSDHQLRWQLADPRAGEAGGHSDRLWVCPSTSRAPEARGGSTDGELVPDVEDPFPAEHSRYLLTGRDGLPSHGQGPRSLSACPRLGLALCGRRDADTGARGTRPLPLRAGRRACGRAVPYGTARPHCLHWFGRVSGRAHRSYGGGEPAGSGGRYRSRSGGSATRQQEQLVRCPGSG
ncbi:acetyltransferase [Streptomyces lividans TK24]|nr:acetyltransferase [Streptomyces lividans TK24]